MRNNDSFWTKVQNFKAQVRRQITQTLQWISTYSVWVRASVGAFIIGLSANISYGFQQATQAITYVLTHIPQLLNRGWNMVIQGFNLGYQLGSYLLHRLANGIVEGFHATIRFIRHIPTLIVDIGNFLYDALHLGYRFGKWLLQNSYQLAKTIVIGLKDLVVDVAKDLWRLARYIVNNIRPLCIRAFNKVCDFIMHIPQLLRDVARFSYEFLILLKDWSVAILRAMDTAIRWICTNFVTIAQESIKALFDACQWAVRKTISGVGIVIGTILGIGSALLEFVADLFRARPAGVPSRELHQAIDDRFDLGQRQNVFTHQYQRHASLVAGNEASIVPNQPSLLLDQPQFSSRRLG